ncbi:MAG: alpha-D-ribose 1-methylphosphonate 5-phosphate C-P-lyase PhnJ [Desulfobacteraceae bacterium]|nr:alpha-D-ribose 1-methylphosphonate 5-phosphate C-P-lyase PhnJ [Desulfobacteraceae bacterium]
MYNFAYLDENSKKMIRQSILKAVAIPGFQVPFAGREMPLPYGWGTGGIQLTSSIIGPDDVLKVIDQGSDDTTNAVSIRKFFKKTADIQVTTCTNKATIIQTRHRIPEQKLNENQIVVYQVPIPEPMQFIEPSKEKTEKYHALEEYGSMYVKIYEDIALNSEITTAFDYPVFVNKRYLMSPSPIPRYDNPKMHMAEFLQLFGAGREKRIYAVPPYTNVKSLDFNDYPFFVETFDKNCEICGSGLGFLDEIITDDSGTRMYVCSDSDFCRKNLEINNGTNN